MSNYLAIATVTATLQRTLQAAVQVDVDGARVTTVRPNNLGSGIPETGVNLFLYQVSANPALGNVDLTPSRAKGSSSKRQTALDLYYILSFYGNETELEPQRLLGSVVRTLNDRSIITAEMIRETVADSTFSFLRESNLAEQVQQVNVTPMDLNLEDLAKVWSVFFQTPYALSIVYKIIVVMIDGEESGKRALLVRDRTFGGIAAFPSQPIIEQVVAQGGKFEPILPNSTLLIQGKNLQSNATRVRLGGIEITPAQVSETQVVLPLSLVPNNSLQAGVQSLQVIHQLAASMALMPNNGVEPRAQNSQQTLQHNLESNVAPFVLRPVVTVVSLSNLEGSRDEFCSAQVTVQVNLTIGKRQRVVLALNQWAIDHPTAYLFDAPIRHLDANSITVPVRNVKPGEYLVRLLVDGAESLLEVDTDSESPTFNWYCRPRLLIA